MILVSLVGGLFLGHELGRNNLGNSFGMAIGTRMLPFLFSAVFAGIFVLAGALFSGAGTTAEILTLAPDFTPMIAFIVCLSSGVVLGVLTKFGIPVSIAQSMIGSLIGAAVFFHTTVDQKQVVKIMMAWIYSPILSFITAFILFKCVRFYLTHRPIRILYRDIFTRYGFILVGSFSAYCIGANNVSVITGPYAAANVLNETALIILICIAIFIGFIRADKQVIKTMSSGVFPLGPVEALIAVFSAALTLFVFSSTTLQSFLNYINAPTFPLIPISVTHALIGSIVGISFAKGPAGLKGWTLWRILGAWVIVPFLSGLISFGVLTTLDVYGI